MHATDPRTYEYKLEKFCVHEKMSSLQFVPLVQFSFVHVPDFSKLRCSSKTTIIFVVSWASKTNKEEIK